VGSGGCDYEGQNKCQSCNAGYGLNSTTKHCIKCPANQYSAGGTGACTACPPYQHSSPGRDRCTQNTCTCNDSSGNPIGTKASGNNCTRPSGSSSGTNIPKCQRCNAGYHLVNGDCVMCPTGTYGPVEINYCKVPDIGRKVNVSKNNQEKQSCICQNGNVKDIDNCSSDNNTNKYNEVMGLLKGLSESENDKKFQLIKDNNNNVIVKKSNGNQLNKDNSSSVIKALIKRFEFKKQRVSCQNCSQDYYLNVSQCSPKICKCPSGCVKREEMQNLNSVSSCIGTGLFWDDVNKKCYKCIKEKEAYKMGMFSAGFARKCSKHNGETCILCTTPGTWLNGNKCITHSKCEKGQVDIRKPTHLSDRVCGTKGLCLLGQWESKPPTATELRHCETVGKCDNGRLIHPSKQKQINHCQSCNPGYRLCKDKSECGYDKLSNEIYKKRWAPFRSCVKNNCICGNGTSVTDGGKSSPLCTSNNQVMCETCKKGYYLKKQKDINGNIIKQECSKWTECSENEWIYQEGTMKQNRICKKCPEGTSNSKYSSNNNSIEKITVCKCKSGYGVPIKNNKGEIIDIKCSCLNGKLKEVKKGEKDCVCNSGYHGGGKKTPIQKDIQSYVPYDMCNSTKKCKCNNGIAATNIPCSLRSIKTITEKRVTNTDINGACPFVNSKGNVWIPSLGPLSSPVNTDFKKSSKICPKDGEELCESCFDGFELNSKEFRLKGKIIKAKTTCVPVNSQLVSISQTQPTVNPITQIKKQVNVAPVKVQQQQVTRFQKDNATMQKYNHMIFYNRR
jgi:hypothetical protein